MNVVCAIHAHLGLSALLAMLDLINRGTRGIRYLRLCSGVLAAMVFAPGPALLPNLVSLTGRLLIRFAR
jgi:hypothetical protein